MRVAVVGGTGFIGRYVARRLAESGAFVTTIGRGTTGLAKSVVRSVMADRGDPIALANALALASPEVVVDMIAYRPEHIESLLEALPSSVERLVVISSGDVYATYGAFLGLSPSSAETRPSDEQAALRTELYPYRSGACGPDDLLYSYEKILVEQAANAWTGGATTILRLPMVYGPNDKLRRVARYVERFQAGADSIHLNTAEAAWCCTRGYVEDVADAINLATLSADAANQTFNLGELAALSEADWVRAIAAAASWHGDVVVDPEIAPTRKANWNVDLISDTTRIRDVLGYDEPVGLEEGLRRTLVWLELE